MKKPFAPSTQMLEWTRLFSCLEVNPPGKKLRRSLFSVKKLRERIKIKRRSKRLEKFSYQNRRQLTPAESAMVRILTDMGWWFNVEHPLVQHNIILDFFVPQHRLVIEVDGGYHARQKERDRARDAALVKDGLIVQRFTNEQVLRFPRKTMATLRKRVK